MKVASRGRNHRSRHSSRGRGRRTGNSPRVSGMHNRRDKRFFCDKPRPLPEDAGSTSLQSEEGSVGTSRRPEWNEAIMLWLSWNSTYEKATAKMCKGGDKEKLDAMLSEMESLRKQAIELSQGLIGCVN